MPRIAPNLILRSETPDDLAFTRSLYARGRADELAATGWPEAMKAAFCDSQFRLQSAHWAQNHPAAERWIVEQRGQAIGRVYAERGAPSWQLLEIGFVPTAQGQGHGTRVIQWLAAQAKAAGATALDLRVAADNIRAAALYRRLGFRPIAGMSATHRAMRLSL